jgi:uncharacterized membrane protein YqjE
MKENLSKEINELKHELEEYVEARVNLTKLHIAGELSHFFSSFMTKTVILYLLFFALLFLSLSGAIILSKWLESYVIGFALTGGFFLLITLVFWLLRKIIIERPVVRRFIDLFFPKFDDDDEE